MNNIIGTMNENSHSLLERILYNNLDGDNILNVLYSDTENTITITKKDLTTLVVDTPLNTGEDSDIVSVVYNRLTETMVITTLDTLISTISLYSNEVLPTIAKDVIYANDINAIISLPELSGLRQLYSLPISGIIVDTVMRFDFKINTGKGYEYCSLFTRINTNKEIIDSSVMSKDSKCKYVNFTCRTTSNELLIELSFAGGIIKLNGLLENETLTSTIEEFTINVGNSHSYSSGSFTTSLINKTYYNDLTILSKNNVSLLISRKKLYLPTVNNDIKIATGSGGGGSVDGIELSNGNIVTTLPITNLSPSNSLITKEYIHNILPSPVIDDIKIANDAGNLYVSVYGYNLTTVNVINVYSGLPLEEDTLLNKTIIAYNANILVYRLEVNKYFDNSAYPIKVRVSYNQGTSSNKEVTQLFPISFYETINYNSIGEYMLSPALNDIIDKKIKNGMVFIYSEVHPVIRLVRNHYGSVYSVNSSSTRSYLVNAGGSGFIVRSNEINMTSTYLEHTPYGGSGKSFQHIDENGNETTVKYTINNVNNGSIHAVIPKSPSTKFSWIGNITNTSIVEYIGEVIINSYKAYYTLFRSSIDSYIIHIIIFNGNDFSITRDLPLDGNLENESFTVNHASTNKVVDIDVLTMFSNDYAVNGGDLITEEQIIDTVKNTIKSLGERDEVIKQNYLKPLSPIDFTEELVDRIRQKVELVAYDHLDGFTRDIDTNHQFNRVPKGSDYFEDLSTLILLDEYNVPTSQYGIDDFMGKGVETKPFTKNGQLDLGTKLCGVGKDSVTVTYLNNTVPTILCTNVISNNGTYLPMTYLELTLPTDIPAKAYVQTHTNSSNTITQLTTLYILCSRNLNISNEVSATNDTYIKFKVQSSPYLIHNNEEVSYNDNLARVDYITINLMQKYNDVLSESDYVDLVRSVLEVRNGGDSSILGLEQRSFILGSLDRAKALVSISEAIANNDILKVENFIDDQISSNYLTNTTDKVDGTKYPFNNIGHLQEISVGEYESFIFNLPFDYNSNNISSVGYSAKNGFKTTMKYRTFKKDNVVATFMKNYIGSHMLVKDILDPLCTTFESNTLTLTNSTNKAYYTQITGTGVVGVVHVMVVMNGDLIINRTTNNSVAGGFVNFNDRLDFETTFSRLMVDIGFITIQITEGSTLSQFEISGYVNPIIDNIDKTQPVLVNPIALEEDVTLSSLQSVCTSVHNLSGIYAADLQPYTNLTTIGFITKLITLPNGYYGGYSTSSSKMFMRLDGSSTSLTLMPYKINTILPYTYIDSNGLSSTSNMVVTYFNNVIIKMFNNYKGDYISVYNKTNTTTNMSRDYIELDVGITNVRVFVLRVVDTNLTDSYIFNTGITIIFDGTIGINPIVDVFHKEQISLEFDRTEYDPGGIDIATIDFPFKQSGMLTEEMLKDKALALINVIDKL